MGALEVSMLLLARNSHRIADQCQEEVLADRDNAEARVQRALALIGRHVARHRLLVCPNEKYAPDLRSAGSHIYIAALTES